MKHSILYTIILLTVIFSKVTLVGNELDFDREKLENEVLSMNTLFEPVYNETVESYIHWYQEASDHYISQLLYRADLYFPTIERVLEEENMPNELKYLVIIESELFPGSSSPKGASGLWQMMPPTAEYYGLNISRYVDERLDYKKSTQSAIRYLKDLYRQFGDWSYVFAAYNSGPGRLRRAIRQAPDSSNYWTVAEHLPQETQKYVPKFLAVQYFFNHMDRSQYEIPFVSPDLLLFDEYLVNQGIDLSDLAAALDVDLAVLEHLNHSWVKGRVPSSRSGYTIRIPSRLHDSFVAYLEMSAEDHASDKLADSISEFILDEHYYHIEYPLNGESIEQVATYFDIEYQVLRYWNPYYYYTRPFVDLWIPKNHACDYVYELISHKPNPLIPVKLDRIESSNQKILKSNVVARPQFKPKEDFKLEVAFRM